MDRIGGDGGEIGLHDAAVDADGLGRAGIALNLVADAPLDEVEQRLRKAGFPPDGTIVDQEWGRSLFARAPDGTVIQIDEQDPDRLRGDDASRPDVAMLARGDLRLVLSAPSGVGGGGQSMPDGTKPEPGGWNRFMLEVPDRATVVSELQGADVEFRNDIVTGVGGKQILLDDPSGNPIELFEPTRPEASLSPG